MTFTPAELQEARAVSIRTGQLEGPREETSLLGFLGVVLMHRRLIAICALGGMLALGISALSEVNYYEAQGSFIVKGSRTPAQIPGGAASLGILLSGTADLGQSTVFFADLALANVIRVAVAKKSYVTSASRGQKLPLATIYGVEEKDPEVAITRTAKILGGHMSTRVYTRSGVVAVSVKSTDPLLAQQLVTSVLSELEAYAARQRHQETVEDVKFIQGVVAEAKSELDRAEERLSTFLSINRAYATAPQLQLEYDRLNRDVTQRQQVYTALTQSLEQARIDEVRNHSPINMVEVADLPGEPLRTAALRRTLLGLSAGLFLGIALAFIRQRVLEARMARTSGFVALTAAASGVPLARFVKQD